MTALALSLLDYRLAEAGVEVYELKVGTEAVQAVQQLLVDGWVEHFNKFD